MLHTKACFIGAPAFLKETTEAVHMTEFRNNVIFVGVAYETVFHMRSCLIRCFVVLVSILM
jgi:hypothetical protein